MASVVRRRARHDYTRAKNIRLSLCAQTYPSGPGCGRVLQHGGYQSAPNEPTQNIVAKRVQHYGFVSEPPDGAEVIAVAINGGASNRAAIAETVTGEPEIENKEVLLWSEFGQRVLLDKNYRVAIDNGNGGTVEVAGFTTTIADDAVVARDLLVVRDTKVDHLLGGSDAVLTCVANVAGASRPRLRWATIWPSM